MQAPCINCFAAYTCMGLARSASKSVCYRNPDAHLLAKYMNNELIIIILVHHQTAVSHRNSYVLRDCFCISL